MNVQNNPPQEPRELQDMDDVGDAILGRWTDGEDLSEDESLEATDETLDETEEQSDYDQEDTEVDETEDETDEAPDEEEEPTTEDEDEEEADEIDISDDTLVEISVDGETKQASLKDLKRLYGQEASLTRKSQETASKRKEAEDALSKADMSYRKLIERAEARYKPYKEVDMLVASRQMEPTEFAKLRQEAKDAESDLKFLTEESNAFYQEANTQRQKQHQEAAQDCVKVLQEQLPDWGNDLYNDIRSYAVSVGLPSEQVDQYVDPQVIMLINKARLYDQSKTTAQTKKAKAKVIRSKTSKGKVLRVNKAPLSDAGQRARNQKQARDKLRSAESMGGGMDDIAEALMSRWER